MLSFQETGNPRAYQCPIDTFVNDFASNLALAVCSEAGTYAYIYIVKL